MGFTAGRMTSPLSKLGATEQTGTKITFKPDSTIFSTTTFVYDTIHKKLQDCAFLNPGIRVYLKDERSGSPTPSSMRTDCVSSCAGSTAPRLRCSRT